MSQSHLVRRRLGPPPQGLALLERLGTDEQGRPYQVSVGLANVFVNGYPVSSNVVALIVAQELERMARATVPALQADGDHHDNA